jgi:hypothetical protein
MLLCSVGIALETLPFIVTFWTAPEPTQPEDSGLLGRDTASLREWLLMFQTIMFPYHPGKISL